MAPVGAQDGYGLPCLRVVELYSVVGSFVELSLKPVYLGRVPLDGCVGDVGTYGCLSPRLRGTE